MLEEAEYAPWIPFEPSQLQLADIQRGSHLPRCVHQVTASDPEISLYNLDMSTIHISRQNEDVKRVIQELCGLAGVSPMSSNVKDWNGDVVFNQDNTHSNVCYICDDDEDSDFKAVLCRITKALEGFYKAFGQIQQARLCCDSFTILVNLTSNPETQTSSPNPELLPTPPQVELWRVDLKPLLQLRRELNHLLYQENITEVDTANFRNIAMKILAPLLRTASYQREEADDGIDYTLHLCALAVQFVCLGLLSYSQAHVGAIHPFFLDTPQKSVLLGGITGKHVKIIVN